MRRASRLWMHFEETMKFGGDAAEVWRRVSAIKEIPRYWHGMRSLIVVGEDDGVVRVKVKFAFGGSGVADITVDDVGRTMTIDYRSGAFTGKQTVMVGEGSIGASWDVKFRGIYRLASRWNEGHFRSGTVHALERLVGRDGPT